MSHSANDDGADPAKRRSAADEVEAMVKMVENLIPLARSVSPTVTVLLALVRRELTTSQLILDHDLRSIAERA